MTIALLFLMIGTLLTCDLYTHRHDRVIPIKNAALWSGVYILAALIFAAFLYVSSGAESSSLFLTGFLLEKMLSVDNLFVWIAIFSYFGIKEKHQHRILHWGVLGAIVFRLGFVAIGTGSLWLFGPFAETAFALIILYTAYLMITSDEDAPVEYDKVWYIRVLKRFLPVTGATRGHAFFIDGKATPLFLCLVAVEVCDILFAFDSVPAVIIVTRDPVLIMSAMTFAILGLRSLYFVLTALKRYLKHLDKAVIVILVLFSLKILCGTWLDFHVEPLLSLAGVLGLLTIGVLFSLGGKNEEAD